MSQEEMLKNLEEEYEDACKYAKLSKEEWGKGNKGNAQIYKDMAKEEYTHGEHLKNMMHAEGIEIPEKYMEKREYAKKTLWM